MILTLRRFASLAESTLGALSIDGRFACFVLEDEHRDVKVKGETRIPAGRYAIKLRTEGRIHDKYASKFTDHRGVLWLQNVPGFEWIYIHTGTVPEHTEGCLLVGDVAMAHGELGSSVQAYRRVYAQASNAILAGEPVFIDVVD